MKVLIVLAHPEPQSFNGAMARTAAAALAEAGHEVQVSDLYAMKWHAPSDRSSFTTVADASYFKPQAEEDKATAEGGFAPDVEAEMQKLEWCDLLIFQFPIWWFGLPAILKGWVDRVFARGRTYGGGRIFETGKLKGRRAMLALTTGGGEDVWKPGARFGDIMSYLLPIHRGMFQFVGMDVLRPQICCAPVRVSEEERRAMLDAWRERCLKIADEVPIDVGRF